MNKIKIMTLLSAILLAGPIPLHADTPSAGVWVDSTKHTVIFASTATLTVALTHIGADETYWDQLDIEISYDAAVVGAQIAALKAKYPGYQVSRALTQADGSFAVSIPILGTNEMVVAETSPDGPFARFQTFVAKDKAAALREAFKQNAATVSFKGRARASVPEVQILERVALPESNCDELLSSGGTTFDLLKRIPSIFGKIDGMNIRLSATRDALKHSVLESCVDFDQRYVESMNELLTTPVHRIHGRQPMGQVTAEVVASEPYSVQFQLNRSIDGAAL